MIFTAVPHSLVDCTNWESTSLPGGLYQLGVHLTPVTPRVTPWWTVPTGSPPHSLLDCTNWESTSLPGGLYQLGVHLTPCWTVPTGTGQAGLGVGSEQMVGRFSMSFSPSAGVPVGGPSEDQKGAGGCRGCWQRLPGL
ncbi:hypothetical protein NHX12_003172 [Muraenolepis orangiensis]|uniref:Uncharacterized protein n=1 Tax=Muraenolepis orangiensis TaxID=630683 RepID=A0A9Q0IGZ0_9TELE|nr:hypothetical protein NHX12_003172 [Muraenolepis orangiensis]